MNRYGDSRMCDETKRTVRVRASSQIVGMKLVSSCAEQDEEDAESPRENLEVPHGPRLGLPRKHAIQMLMAGEVLNELRLRRDHTE